MTKFIQGISALTAFISFLLLVGFAGGIDRGADPAQNFPAMLICLAVFALSAFILNLTEKSETQ
jgi:hypothetical protein